MGRYENVAVFKDTEELIRTNEKLKSLVQASTNSQKLILENDKIAVPNLQKNEEEAKVIVSKKRTYEAASAYKGMKIAVHNFASAVRPGGGVETGATAQEECLCRCSGLYFNLNVQAMKKAFYNPHKAAHNPMYNGDIIYTPNVIVFKTDTVSPKLMEEKDWYGVDVITCAAPNLRVQLKKKCTPKELKAIHEKRLRRILDVAVLEGNEVVILGAFGCGAFMNDPRVVAEAYKTVIKDYVHAFKTIEFAVYCSPRSDENYRAFKSRLG